MGFHVVAPRVLPSPLCLYSVALQNPLFSIAGTAVSLYHAAYPISRLAKHRMEPARGFGL